VRGRGSVDLSGSEPQGTEGTIGEGTGGNDGGGIRGGHEVRRAVTMSPVGGERTEGGCEEEKLPSIRSGGLVDYTVELKGGV